MAATGTLEVTAPGKEVTATTPLRVDTGDTVAIGDVTTSVSDTRLTVSSAAMNSAAVTVLGTEYPANTVVTYTLTVTGSVTRALDHWVKFTYTTAAGDERIVYQPVSLVPYFEAAGGVLVYGGGLITSLTSAPAAALYPGIYDVDTSSAAFTVELRQVKGAWLFLDSASSTVSNNLTIGTSSQTFNGVTGPLTMDGAKKEVRVYNLAGSTAFKVTL